MASEVFEKPIDLEIGLLEAAAPTELSYPYPSLKPTGKTERRTFDAAILENDYLRATFYPALGARLLSLLDKRTGIECLGHSFLTPVEGGPRGARLEAGVQLHLNGQERLTALARVQSAGEPADDGRPAGLWFGEAVTGTGVSWHLHVTLPDDRAELQIEARILNRTFAPVPYNPGLLVPAAEAWHIPGCIWTETLGFIVEGRWSPTLYERQLVVCRWQQPRMLASRQLDTWRMSLVPISGLSPVHATSASASMSVAEDAIQIQSAGRLEGYKLVLLTDTGNTLEAPLSLDPMRIESIPMPSTPAAIAIVDGRGSSVLEFRHDSEPVARNLTNDQVHNFQVPALTASNPDDLVFDVCTRHIAHTVMGERDLGSGDFSEADEHFERALLYNADDHLLWWSKALAKRLRGELEDEGAELLNAHYLAPLEPLLRAESFFAQPATAEREGSALLKPMAEHPENFVEIAATLIALGLYEQAARWIDEALRHANLAMLHYLLAYSHLQISGMDIEAANHVQEAARAEPTPFPWRGIELKALAVLHDRFPDDERISELARKLR